MLMDGFTLFETLESIKVSIPCIGDDGCLICSSTSHGVKMLQPNENLASGFRFPSQRILNW